MLTNRIKNADRVLKANDLIVKAIEHEVNRDVLIQMLEVSQAISDIHKACVADFKNARNDEV